MGGHKAIIRWSSDGYWSWEEENVGIAPLYPHPPLLTELNAGRAGLSQEDGGTAGVPEAASLGQTGAPSSSSDAGPENQSARDSERGDAAGHAHLRPGELCGECGRKIPHPRKPDSPHTSKSKAYRIPQDEIESHEEVLEAAAVYTGASDKPFASFKVLTLALVALLNDPDARGYWERNVA